MKKLLQSGIVFMVMAFFLMPVPTQAFSSATHVYIAEQVFPKSHSKIDLYYGSIAPDLALYVGRPGKWPTAFDDTHYNFIKLSPYAWSLTQKTFAKGWLTHNELWGADYYAHICFPITTPPSCTAGYVVNKAEELLGELPGPLSGDPDLDLAFAHVVIETAIDLLVKNDDPKVGEKLLQASLFRSWEDRNLLATGLVWKARETDWVTLASAELTFRNLVARYAVALALPAPFDKKALADLGVELAQELYGITVTRKQLLGILEIALSLCGDYKDAIDAAIAGIISSR